MSVVIIGGHDRMVCQYSNFKSKIGNPDLLVLFTSTVSHSMVHGALQEAIKNNITVARSHSSSSCALKKILDYHCC